MEPKKNPKIDAGRNSSLYFSLGLICVLSVSYAILQTAMLEKPIIADASSPKEDYVIMPQDFDKKIKIIPTEVKLTRILTDKFKIVKDPITSLSDKPTVDQPVEQGTYESAKDLEPVKAKDVVFIEPMPEETIVEWINIEDTPVFPGCENVSKDERRKCFEKKLRDHIQKHQRFPDYAVENNISGRVNTQFIIDIDGQVKVATMRGTHSMFEKEVQRVLNLLPKMTAGKQGLKAVKVSYAMPFSFKLE